MLVSLHPSATILGHHRLVHSPTRSSQRPTVSPYARVVRPLGSRELPASAPCCPRQGPPFRLDRPSAPESWPCLPNCSESTQAQTTVLSVPLSLCRSSFPVTPSAPRSQCGHVNPAPCSKLHTTHATCSPRPIPLVPITKSNPFFCFYRTTRMRRSGAAAGKHALPRTRRNTLMLYHAVMP